MKLLVKEKGKIAIHLHLPNFLIKNKFVAKSLLKRVDISTKDVKQMQECLKDIHKYLKAYTKKNGHFTFLEVYSGGCSVTITI